MTQDRTSQQSTAWTLLGDNTGEMFHEFSLNWSKRISPENPIPETPEEWVVIREARRAWLRKAIGLVEEEPCPLQPEITGIEDRGDYLLEKTILHSRPNLLMTTHLYVPKNVPKPGPAILSVHGHTGLGKLDPNIQTRNIGMTRLGFVVLCVDAIGSSERAYRGETYHGRQLGAQAFPAGLSVTGLQVWDNMRALDYLCSRSEVDASRIACTGASGGCNQTLYLSALDERIAAAAPVCCIGSLEGYLNGGHCVCEMVPGIKQVAEMVDVLSLIAPRPLIIINGIHDGGAGFQIKDMRIQFPKLKKIYELLGAGEKLAKCEIDLGHGYFPTMREVMYAWFRRWLQGVEADLCPEPAVDPVEPEKVWCFADGKVPEQYDTVPILVCREGKKLSKTYPAPSDIINHREALLAQIESELFSGFPRDTEPAVEDSSASLPEGCQGMIVDTEPGIRIPLVIRGDLQSSSCLIVLSKEGKASLNEKGVYQSAIRNSQSEIASALAVPDLRGVGELTWDRSAAVGVWDYQLFQSGTILGRPVLGMWVWDVLQCLKILHGRFSHVSILGRDVMAIVALFAAAFDEKVETVHCEQLLSSYLYPEGFSREHSMSLFVPSLLKYVDVPQLAALIAPRKLAITGAVDGGYRELSQKEILDAFQYTFEVYQKLGAEEEINLLDSASK